MSVCKLCTPPALKHDISNIYIYIYIYIRQAAPGGYPQRALWCAFISQNAVLSFKHTFRCKHGILTCNHVIIFIIMAWFVIFIIFYHRTFLGVVCFLLNCGLSPHILSSTCFLCFRLLSFKMPIFRLLSFKMLIFRQGLFIGWAHNNFNNLRFNTSLDTQNNI